MTAKIPIVLIQPSYAHYRQGLFDRLHAGYDVTFVFLHGKGVYPSHLSPRPEWKCITLAGEKMRGWSIPLVRLLLQCEPAVIITPTDTSLQTLLSVLVGRLRGIPVILWSEFWGLSDRWLGSPWWKERYWEMRARWATARVDAVVLGGTRCLEYHRRLGVTENRMFFSPQSTIDHRSLVDPDEADETPPSKEPTVNILYFSRVVKFKGLDVLLRAFAGLVSQRTEARLTIVGEGPFRTYCEQLRDDLRIPNVHFLGSIRNDEAWKHYRKADIFVLPCSGEIQPEAWGLVINEALSMSLPVVATQAVGCVPDLVQDGRNGYVVAPGDVGALRRALHRLVEDRPRREQMGKKSRAIFEEFNSYEKEYCGFDSAIRFVLGQRRPVESHGFLLGRSAEAQGGTRHGRCETRRHAETGPHGVRDCEGTNMRAITNQGGLGTRRAEAQTHGGDIPESPPETTTGYLHPQYAASLAEYGLPRELPRCGAWVLQRAIPSVPSHDAMGCYPLFACRDWSQLAADLEDLADDVVCLSVVTDPFGDYDEARLKQCFQDKVVPFKEHFCIDLERPMEEYVHPDHRRKAYKALARLQVEPCENAAACVDDWVRLYGHLIQRHGITGLLTFSRTVFARQFEVPGLVVFRALHEGVPIGMLLFYVQGDVAYYHLGAHSPLGYEMGSSFALFWRLIEHLRDRGLKRINLGAGAGIGGEATDGLSRFKRGWSTGTRTAYFCGRVFDRTAYDRIVKIKGLTDAAYFPAYRQGEFH